MAERGIPRAGGALAVLQNWDANAEGADRHLPAVHAAAKEVFTYHAPTPDQAERHRALQSAFLTAAIEVVMNCPAGPERSTAISRLREAKMWASAAIALEPQ